MTKQTPISYASSGVQYDSLDLLKRLAQKGALETSKNLNLHDMQELPASRGESAFVWKSGDVYYASVIEGLGTKNLVADKTRAITGKSHYDQIAQDTVAMIVNDLIVVGAAPLVLNAYFACGDSAWINDEERTRDLVTGWAAACQLAGVTWGGGETPGLKGIIEPSTVDLAGSCVGIIQPATRLTLGDKLADGDSILLIESSGIHANGLSLARTIAEQLPKGYATKLKDGKGFGESLLTPTHIYARLVQELFAEGIDIHYMVNITGHGWRKLMRANEEFTYRMTEVPPAHEVFNFIAEHSHNDEQEMYGNFNMGAGFAVYLPKNQAEKAQKIARKNTFESWVAGSVEKGPKRVIIEPKNLTFEGKSLTVR